MPAPTTTQDLVTSVTVVLYPRATSLSMSRSVRPFNGLEVDVHGVVHFSGVAAGHRHGYRNAALPARFEHEAVAFCEALLADAEAAEPVVLVRVGSGEVDRELRSGSVQCFLERALEGVEVLSVVGAVREGDVQVALLLRKGSSWRRGSRT